MCSLYHNVEVFYDNKINFLRNFYSNFTTVFFCERYKV